MSRDRRSTPETPTVPDGDRQELLLEQYKLYVELTDRLGARRADANKLYTSLLAGLLAVVSLVVEKNALGQVQAYVFLAVGLLGVVLCAVWLGNISSYRQLASGRYKVIHQMERELPFHPFTLEWEVLNRGEDGKTYRRLTQVERYVPLLLATPYLLLLLYSLYLLGRLP